MEAPRHTTVRAIVHRLAVPMRRISAHHIVLLVYVTVLSLLLASASFAGVLESQLAQTKAQKAKVKGKITQNDQAQKQVLALIDRSNVRINAVNVPIAQLEGEIASLQEQIGNRRARIRGLRVEYRQQAKQITRLSLELGDAQDLLAMRLVEAYKRGETQSASWLFGSESIADAFDRKEKMDQVLGLDKHVVEAISETERKIRVKRARNHAIQRDIRSDINSISADLRQTDAKRAQLVGKRRELEQLKAERNGYLRRLEAQHEHLDKEFDQLEENAEALKDAIESGATSYQGSVPGGGAPGALAWPVSGPVVSPFGWRWGRMHEGIDIAVGAGTPIHAAAAGVVTYCGWMSGYGNMIIVQHAGSLSTAYAHQSRLGSTCGQFVTQGQVIGYVGCTGHCFGDHLHFETRINGSAVNPMNYL